MKFDRITVKPEIMNGQPCLRGTRLTVRRVVEALAVYAARACASSPTPCSSACKPTRCLSLPAFTAAAIRRNGSSASEPPSKMHIPDVKSQKGMVVGSVNEEA